MVAKRPVAPDECMTNEEFASSGTIMDATRIAAICAKIDEYAGGRAPMSGRQVAAICAMIDDRAAAGKTRRNKRRKKLCVDSIRSYKQIGEIGHGSSGAVVKAVHRTTGQTVAIKTFRRRDGRTEGPDVSGELLREACFLAACGGHPHLVGLHAVTRDPRTNKYSLVMEYVGPSLKERLRVHGGAFPEVEVRRIMRQLLAGAEAMHAYRIVHRDIKTGNVLVGEEEDDGGGVVKICDYGLAMCTANAGPPYKRVGTAWYMAPEVLMHRTDYDERVDLWSLGCVMAELLSGEVLFKVGKGGVPQLDRMFDVLGTPDEQTLQAFAPPFAVGKVLRWLARRPRSCHHHGRLRELFPSETLSRDGFDVLKGLLTFNPKERLTTAATLRLPWFTGAAVDAPATETAGASSFFRVLAGVLAFLSRMALKLIRQENK
nr:unnamed protein product [Digitaria exilis]